MKSAKVSKRDTPLGEDEIAANALRLKEDLQVLAKAFITEGKEAMMIQFNKIVEKRKLTVSEVCMISDKLRDLLVSNGYVIPRKRS